MKVFRPVFLAAMIGALMAGGSALGTSLDSLERISVDLVAPPFVHDHEQTAPADPRVVQFRLTVDERKIVIDDKGTTMQAMMFNNSMPGPTMVVHEGDYVEITLVNPDTNSMPHNIDLHTVAGALGGAQLTDVNPGEEATLRFKADRSGVFVYHCAPEGMVPWHVVAGMSGTIMVLPRDGLKDPAGNSLTYDTAYTIGEFDLYIPQDEEGNYKDYDTLAESYADTVEVMRTLTPTHVVFNGAVNALTGERAMPAKVGETVLIIHSQANRDTRPHLIGGHGDWVWETGKFSNPPEKDLETWFIRGGSAGAALYTFKQPGVYAYVNHNLIEAFELGASGHFVVEGDWDHDLTTQVKAAGPLSEESKDLVANRTSDVFPPSPEASAKKVADGHAGVDLSSELAMGEKLYNAACVACHSTGIANAPKLGDAQAWEPIIERGMDAMMGVTLNGKGAMPPRGGTSADDETLRAAVEYMINAVN